MPDDIDNISNNNPTIVNHNIDDNNHHVLVAEEVLLVHPHPQYHLDDVDRREEVPVPEPSCAEVLPEGGHLIVRDVEGVDHREKDDQVGREDEGGAANELGQPAGVLGLLDGVPPSRPPA